MKAIALGLVLVLCVNTICYANDEFFCQAVNNNS